MESREQFRFWQGYEAGLGNGFPDRYLLEGRDSEIVWHGWSRGAVERSGSFRRTWLEAKILKIRNFLTELFGGKVRGIDLRESSCLSQS
jgi:hypothetical protein